MDDWIDGPVLGIETSGRLTGLALVENGRLLAESSIDLRASSQELLPGLLQNLLTQLELELSDLARIGVSLGPGSFTGLRVGLSWARALSVGSGVPLVGVLSHPALAYAARDSGGQILVLTGFRRGQVCLELGIWSPGGEWQALVPGASRPVSRWSQIVQPFLLAERPLIFLGEAVESALNVDDALRSRGEVWADPLTNLRRPGPVAFLAAHGPAREFCGDAVDEVTLLYMRDADAKKPSR